MIDVAGFGARDHARILRRRRIASENDAAGCAEGLTDVLDDRLEDAAPIVRLLGALVNQRKQRALFCLALRRLHTRYGESAIPVAVPVGSVIAVDGVTVPLAFAGKMSSLLLPFGPEPASTT